MFCNGSGNTADLVCALRHGEYHAIARRLQAQGLRTNDYSLKRAAESTGAH